MKHYFIYILLLNIVFISGQRKGAAYISVLGGYEKNGWTLDVQGDLNNYASGVWRATVGLESEKYTFRDEKIPVMLYLGTANYLHQILSFDKQERVVLRMGGGIVGGWEQVNKDKKYLSSGYEITQKSQAIYGLNFLMEAELFLFDFGHSTQEVWFILQGNYHYFIKSDVGDMQPTIKAGFKIDLGTF